MSGSNKPKGVSLESSLPLIAMLDMNVVVTPPMSSLVKYQALCSLSMRSGMRGRGAAFLTVMSFR